MPDLTKAGYETAQSKSIQQIGTELKKVYETVLKGSAVDSRSLEGMS